MVFGTSGLEFGLASESNIEEVRSTKVYRPEYVVFASTYKLNLKLSSTIEELQSLGNPKRALNRKSRFKAMLRHITLPLCW
jgi:hypothetical protein